MPVILKMKLLFFSKGFPIIPIKYVYEKTKFKFDDSFRKEKLKQKMIHLLNLQSQWFLRIFLKFLEDFSINRKKINEFGWPNNPTNILTSIGQWYNEYFKIYVAEKKLLNCKLLISQHGGSYGTAKFSVGEFFEKKICNKFLSWGWSDSPKVIPL